MRGVSTHVGGLALALILSGCGGDPCEAGKSIFTGQIPAQCQATTAASGSTTSTTAQPGQRMVAYAISGTATAATVYFRHTGGSLSQVTGVSLPWSFQFASSAGETLYVSAYNDGADASITAAIMVEGVAVKAVTATGVGANARATSSCC